MILYQDTINVSEIFTPRKKLKTDAQTFAWPKVPRTSFLWLRMLMQRRRRTKTTKARNHFFISILRTSPSASTGPRPRAAVRNRLWHRYPLHFIIQTVNCGLLSEMSTGHPGGALTKTKAWRIEPRVHCGGTDASTICPVESRYEPLGDIIHHKHPFVLGRTLWVHLLLGQQGYITFTGEVPISCYRWITHF